MGLSSVLELRLRRISSRGRCSVLLAALRNLFWIVKDCGSVKLLFCHRLGLHWFYQKLMPPGFDPLGRHNPCQMPVLLSFRRPELRWFSRMSRLPVFYHPELRYSYQTPMQLFCRQPEWRWSCRLSILRFCPSKMEHYAPTKTLSFPRRALSVHELPRMLTSSSMGANRLLICVPGVLIHDRLLVVSLWRRW